MKPAPPALPISIGDRFGRLAVVGEPFRVRGTRSVETACSCGRRCISPVKELVRGRTRSCGCLRRELAADQHRTHGRAKTRDGKAADRTYVTWAGMLDRCRRARNKKFKYYGGRGITVCDRWQTFGNFLADMGEKPVGLSIDRINNDGNYEPGNCRWATQSEQVRNRRILSK